MKLPTLSAPSVDLERRRRQEGLLSLIAAEEQQLSRALGEMDDRDMVQRLSTPPPPAPGVQSSSENALDDELALDRVLRVHLIRKLKDTVNFFVIEQKRSKTELADARLKARETEFLQGEVRRLTAELSEGKRGQVTVVQAGGSSTSGEISFLKNELSTARNHLTEAARLVRLQMARISDKNAEIASLRSSNNRNGESQVADLVAANNEQKSEIARLRAMINNNVVERSIPSSTVIVNHSSPSLSRHSAAADSELKLAKAEVARLQRELQNSSANVSLPASHVTVNHFSRLVVCFVFFFFLGENS
jgi:hypothetical protein